MRAEPSIIQETENWLLVGIESTEGFHSIPAMRLVRSLVLAYTREFARETLAYGNNAANLQYYRQRVCQMKPTTVPKLERCVRGASPTSGKAMSSRGR